MYNRYGVFIMIKHDADKLSLILRDKRYKGNPLFQARKDFDIAGLKIFLLGVQELMPYMEKHDKFLNSEIKELFISKERLKKISEGSEWFQTDLDKVCDKMFRSVIKFPSGEDDFEFYHLFRKLKFVSNEGLYIWFDDIMRPYILDLFQTRGYSRLNLQYLFSLSSRYAVRLLELLLLYKNSKQFHGQTRIACKFSIEELRFALSVPEGSYEDRVDNFRRFVINIAIKDIMKRTPYLLHYEMFKVKRKIAAINFIMDTSKVPTEAFEEFMPQATNEATEMLIALGFSDKDAQEIFRKCRDVDDCLSRINRAQGLFDRQKGSVTNKLGFLRKAIESEWHANRSSAKSKTKSSETFMEYENPNLLMQESGKILVGRKKMSYRLAEALIDHIRRNDTSLVSEYLAEYNISIEKFTAICRKHGL